MQVKHRRQLMKLALIIVSLIFLIALLTQNQKNQQQQSPVWSLQSAQQQKELLAWEVNSPNQLTIDFLTQDESIQLVFEDHHWRSSEHAFVELDQLMIEDILERLQKSLVTPVIQEHSDSVLTQQLRITLANPTTKQSLVIANATATQTAHYAYFIDRPQAIFLVDSTLVELLKRPKSHYYAINLPEFKINQIKKLSLINQFGSFSIHRNASINDEFVSWYHFTHPYPSFMQVDNYRLYESFLSLWRARTPINVVNFYQPNLSLQQLTQYGLSPAQATLTVEHLDESVFTVELGYSADLHHFYAKELNKSDLWLLPSDLAQNIFNLQAFQLVSRPLSLIDVKQVKIINFINHKTQQSITLKKHSATQTWTISLNNHTSQTLNQQQIAMLYEKLLLLHYEQPSETAHSQSKADYSIEWILLNNTKRLYHFYQTDAQNFHITITENANQKVVNAAQTHLKISKHQLQELWQLWHNMFAE